MEQPKTARDWPAKKKQSPPERPKFRIANRQEKQQAQRLKGQEPPTPFAA